MALAVDKQPAAQNFDCQFRKNLITGKSRCIESDFLVTIAGVFHVGNRTNRTSCPEIASVWLGTGIESGFGFGNRSQGQGQLLAIARAAVADPPVMVLDEATSSIDTRTEKHIEHGMDRLMAGKTTFVIAHRLSTVRESNAIMVLEDGRIIERGDHNALMAQQGRYYQLCTGKAKLS